MMSNAESPKHDETDVRFSVRSLLVMTVVVAVVCAALGAFLRRFPAEAQPRLLAYWGVLLVLLLGVIAWNSWRRWRAERKAGRVMFQLIPHSYFLPEAPRLASLMAGLLLLMCGPAAWVFGSYFVADAGPQAVGVHSVYGIIGSSLGITCLWWHSRVRLCEHGMVVRHNFVPWSDVKRWFWDAGYRDVVVFEFTWFNQVALNVPDESREAVVQFLSASCGEEYD